MAGLLKVISSGELKRQEEAAQALYLSAEQSLSEQFTSALSAHLRRQFEHFKRHRTTASIDQRLLDSLRAYNGEYDPTKLREIKGFGGSEVYARLTAIKCRSATAILRDIYLSGRRPWTVDPTPVPDLPMDVQQAVDVLIDGELQTLVQAGQTPPPALVEQRRGQLIQAAWEAARKQARERALDVERALDDVLLEGGFYRALELFLLDLPVFMFACIKGPTARLMRSVQYTNGRPKLVMEPKWTWQRVSPFDLCWTPGVSDLREADVIERVSLRRADIQALIGMPGYDDDALRQVLMEYRDGYYERMDGTDTERAEQEDKENPIWNESGMVDMLDCHIDVPGEYLKDWNGGSVVRGIENFDEAIDYHVTACMVGRHVIKAQIAPPLAARHPYYFCSFERVAGSPIGRALPEILSDSQNVANAALRSLVNNASMSSGPQVVVNVDRIGPTTNPNTMFPWKRWHIVGDPMAVSGEKPIDFFQPQSNAQELLFVLDRMMLLSDEVSGIPRYMTGENRGSGAAATASGLSMLINNASKILQQVAGQIDSDVLEPVLSSLYSMMLLTDKTGWFEGGDDTIRARGVVSAMAKEANRQRQLEFLQITANPLDQQVVGVEGRAALLRAIADGLGLDGEKIVLSQDDLARQQQQQAAMMQEMAAQAQGAQPGMPGPDSGARVNRGLDNAQRARTPQAINQQVTP